MTLSNNCCAFAKLFLSVLVVNLCVGNLGEARLQAALDKEERRSSSKQEKDEKSSSSSSSTLESEKKGKEAFKTFGTFRLSSCKADDESCRRKRSEDDDELSSSDLTLHLKTDAPIFSSSGEVEIRLRRSAGILAPFFKLIVRDGDDVTVNRTVPYPTCLYTGFIPGEEEGTEVAVSTCHRNRLSGIILSEDKNLVMEELHPDHPDFENSRPKRSPAHNQPSSGIGRVVVFDSAASGGECGLKPKNMARMRAPRAEAILLKDRSTSAGGGLFARRRRRKRSSGKDKAIELAVFVDDDLYTKEVGVAPADPLADIQNLVFTYLNAVQLFYNSKVLDTQFRIVLVRLEIFKSPISTIDKSGGEIEHYLDSFCGWQKAQNPGAQYPDLGDREDPGHWDHGLMLTGLNLYDGQPQFDTVIGLAWVSGMCHPAYSCSISEGGNFESVFVIAHEMGHNLGMNHDGDTKEGNTCDPDKYLMSPVLGPGKVTWSTCSNKELEDFLSGRHNAQGFGITKSQADCLDDLPAIIDHYDYLKDKVLPGEKFSAIEQCQRAFGKKFVPHVKAGETPFDDLCRELWCANDTHALRAHPALEGTDCSSKPYPYGSICVTGVCTAFNPNQPIVPSYGSEQPGQSNQADNSSRRSERIPSAGSGGNASGDNDGRRVSESRPAWYDPIFTEIFTTLREKFSERYPSENGRTRVLPALKALTKEDLAFEFINETLGTKKGKASPARWTVAEEECPVECGGGWVDVVPECSSQGKEVEPSNCVEDTKPDVMKTTCNIEPCY